MSGTATAPATFRRALSHREFRAVAAGLAVSAAGTWLYNVALVVFVFERTQSATWTAAAAALRMAPAVLFGAFGGVIADRFERRSIMITSDLTRAVLQVGLAVDAWLTGPPALAIALAFLSTTAGTPFRPAAGAMTPLLVGADDLAAANSLLVTIDNLALIIGPAIGGALLAAGSPGVAFLLNALSFVASAGAVATVSMRARPERGASAAGVLHSMAEGARTLWHTRGGPVLAAFLMGSTFVYGAETVLLVVVCEQLLGVGSEGLGYLLGAVGLGSIVAAGLAARLVSSRRPAVPLAIGLVGMGVPLAILPVVHRAWVAVALMFVQGLGVVLLDVLVPTLLQRAVHVTVLGRVIGLVNSFVIAASLVGSLLAPLLLHALGLTGSLLLVGLVVPGIAVASLPIADLSGVLARQPSPETAARVALLRGLAIFEGVSPVALEAVADAAADMRLAPRTRVIRENDAPDDFYVVRSGSLRVTARGELSARARTVNTLGPGDYFGEIGLLEGIPRTATVTTTTDAELLRISGSEFLDLVNTPGVRGGMLADGVTTRLARTHPSRAAVGAQAPVPT